MNLGYGAILLLYAPVPSSTASAPAKWNERSAMSKTRDKKSFMMTSCFFDSQGKSVVLTINIRGVGGSCVGFHPTRPPAANSPVLPRQSLPAILTVVYLGQSGQRRLVLPPGVTVKINSWVVALVVGPGSTEPIAYSDNVGKWEKCHYNQIVTVSRGSLVTNQSFGTCQKCHCKRGVTVNSVTVSREICSHNIR